MERHSQSSLIAEMLKKMQLKSPRSLTNIEEREEPSLSPTEREEEEELSSGEEELEMREGELEAIKKDIFKIGCMNRDNTRREIYSMAEKKVELAH